MNTFLQAYIEAALWSSHDEGASDGGEPLDQNYDSGDLAEETLEKMMADCKRFQEENRELLEASGLSDEQAGHDFWLTRCGHGAGFWDRDLDEIGEKLTKACDAFGNVDLYVGDDGKIYC